MATQHNCSQCEYLTRTSPTQVFLLCKFWAGAIKSGLGIRKAFDQNYVVLHCHMQPEAPACPYIKLRQAVA